MKGYVISEVEVLDDAGAAEYRRLAEASIHEYGGRYLVRGSDAHTIEGDPTSRKVVIIEFLSLAAAREWYASEAYAEALRVRQTAFDRRLIFVEGVVP
ncbi:MAG: DUF1330 domain-containing protein [Capsulimonas sp.]|uniref:DUF1330 domain-containing protein n=1 Tax=Capsulimonas sp. TaxID=2494211 RepID=UPI003264ABE7